MEMIMENGNLHLLSTYLKKWSYQENRLSLSYSYFTALGYGRSIVDMRINSPQIMVNELLNKLIYKVREEISSRSQKPQDTSIKFVNESEIQRKLNMFISKILKEFNTNKRSRGHMRMITHRSMDFYYNDFEYDPLDNTTKFYVHLNRGINKINGDLWSAAVDDLKIALSFNADDLLANKYIAKALLKNHRAEEALPYLEKYSENEDSLKGLNELAHAYIKLEKFKDAEKIFEKMKSINSDDLLAKIGQAQIAYLQGKAYQSLLDKIRKTDEQWLREYLKKTWEYNLPGYSHDETKMWNAATSARYLGFDRPFDLTKRAFNDEIPSYFDSEKGTIRFAREELDNLVEIVNRYNVDGVQQEVYEDRLNEKELEIGKPKKKRKSSKQKSPTE